MASILEDLKKAVFESRGYWEDVNFPTKKIMLEKLYRTKDDNCLICPNLLLIVKAAALVGISRNDIIKAERFCGLRVVHENSLGPLCGRRGENYVPQTMCGNVLRALTYAIHLVEKNEECYLEASCLMLYWNQSEDEITTRINRFLEKIRAKTILNLWLQLRPKDDISAVITYAKDIKEELAKIVESGNTDTVCPYQPQERFSGMVS